LKEKRLESKMKKEELEKRHHRNPAKKIKISKNFGRAINIKNPF